MMDDDLYVIWSIEHTAWWAPGECGYTTSLQDAGRYPRARAAQIVARANLARFHECMIPVTALDDADSRPLVGWSFN